MKSKPNVRPPVKPSQQEQDPFAQLEREANEALLSGGIDEIELMIRAEKKVIALHEMETDARIRARQSGGRVEDKWEVPPGAAQRAVANLTKLIRMRSELLEKVGKAFEDTADQVVEPVDELLKRRDEERNAAAVKANAHRPTQKPGDVSADGEPRILTASAPSSQEGLHEVAQATPSGGR